MSGKMILSVLLLLAALCLPVLEAEARTPAWQRDYQEGCQQESVGSLKKAEEYYRKAVKGNPAYVPALFRLALVCEYRKDYDEAKLHYEKLLEVNPQFAPALNNLAILCYRRGDMEKATQLWLRSLRLAPEQEAVYSNLGMAALVSGNPDRALKYFDRALDLKPQYKEAAVNRAAALVRLNLYREADAQYEKNTKLFSSDPHTYYHYALFCTDTHQAAKAVRLLTNAVKMRSDAPEFYGALAEALADCGRYDEACVNAEKALALKPDSFLSERNAAYALYMAGRHEESLLHYLKARRLAPDDEKIVLGLGALYLAMDREDAALSLWTGALDGRKKFPLVRTALADCYEASGRRADAERELSAALAADAGCAEALCSRGFILMDRGEFSAAAADFETAVRSRPYYAPAYNGLALCRMEQGQRGAALSSLELALELRPDYVDSYCTMGLVYFREKEYEKAMSAWLAGLKVDGAYTPLYYHLGVASEAAGDYESALNYYGSYLRLAPDGEEAAEIRRRMSEIPG